MNRILRPALPDDADASRRTSSQRPTVSGELAAILATGSIGSRGSRRFTCPVLNCLPELLARTTFSLRLRNWPGLRVAPIPSWTSIVWLFSQLHE